MPRYVSRLAAGWVDDPAARQGRVLRGSAVLADLSGFTRLTERLTSTGAEGVETLHRVVNASFDALLGRSLGLGGDVIGFAGDAALVWFDADEHDDHVGRAVEAAALMPRDLGALPAATTGRRRLRVSVGVHTGEFHAVLAGTRRRGLFLHGSAMSLLVRLQSAAGGDQVLMSPAVAAQVRAGWCGDAVAPGIVLRGVRPSWSPGPATGDPADGASLPPAELVSPSVLELLAAGTDVADHRTVSVGFVRLSGLEAMAAARGHTAVRAALDDVVDLVERVARDEGVEWLDVDVGVDSVKLLLAAGAPRSLEHDEVHLLAALRRILDDSPVPLSAGAQRGRVFAGLLGVSGRRAYTLLGDPVNVAARALALAGDGELVVGDGLGVGARSYVVADALGPAVLKNRAQPVEMWRVRSVGRRPAERRVSVSSAGSSLRRREAAALATAWKRTVDGLGRVVSVVGEPGMGASELLADVVELAGGAAVAVVADPLRQHVPFAGLAAIVGGLAATNGVEVASPAEAWTWLQSFAPHLPARLRDWVPAALAAAAQTDVHLIDPRTTAQRTQTVLAALVAEALPAPCLVAVDDVDRLDEASRLVIGRLREVASRRPLMLLVSHAPGATPLGPRLPGDVVIELVPLSVDEATELVIELAPRARDDVVARIVAAAAGNPFVLAELCRHPAATDLPDSLQRLGAWLLDALPPRARALVRDASIFGTTFSPATVADVLGRPELGDPMAWARTASLIAVIDDDTVAFRHEAYRRVAYESLPFHRRRALHSAIADRLAAEAAPSGALLAGHLQLAGREAEAYPVAVQAGYRAKASGALAEAVDLLERAAAMARTVDRDAAATLLLDEGEARVWLSDLDGADRCFRAAAKVVVDPVERGRMCHLRADLAIRRNQFAAARRWATTGLAATVGHEDAAGELRCFLLLDHAARLDLSGAHRRSLPLSHQALEWAQAKGSALMEGIAHLHLEMAYGAMMDLRAVEHGDAAICIFEAIGHDRLLDHALTNSGLTAMYLGRWDDAIDRYERAIEGFERNGHVLGAAITLCNIGFVYYRQGHLDRADEHGVRAVRVFDAAGLPHTAAFPRLLRAWVAAADRRFDDAAALVAEARAALEAVGDEAMVLDCDVTSVAHLVLAGRFAEAVHVGRSLADWVDKGEPEIVVTLGRTLGRAEWELGDAAGLERIHAALASAREQHLLYEVYCCLSALLEIAAAGGPVVAAPLREERDELVRSLGIEG